MHNYRNPVKLKLAAGDPVVAVTVTSTSLDSAAQLASLPFDFLWCEMEHSPLTLETLRAIVLATRGAHAVPFARVPVNEIWTAKRVLDCGVHGVIFPFTSTPALARQAAAACRYPKTGRRGSGAGLAKFSWPQEDGDFYDSADRNVVVIAIIEEAAAVEQVDEIAATPGIDVLFIGTSDLSFSLGLRGQQEHRVLQHAIERVLKAAKRHGKAAGRPAGSAERAREFVTQGFQLIQAPTDLNFLMSGAQSYLEKFGKQATIDSTAI